MPGAQRSYLHKRLIIRWTLVILIGAAGFGLLAWFRWGTTRNGIPPSLPVVTLPAAAKGQIQLFVLAGQSNMSGRGTGPSSLASHPQIFLFGNDYRWHQAVEPLDRQGAQVDDASRDGEVGVGPGLAFAHALVAHDPDAIIGLIPCALGGSPIEMWQRDVGDETLYGSCLKRVRAASAVGNVAGVLFFQGEADAVDPAQVSGYQPVADRWADLFTALVAHWRHDFGVPNLPIVFAQIGSTTAPQYFSNWSRVQAQQVAVKLPDVSMITTADLPLEDFVHFSTASYEVIGDRFATAYLAMTSNETKP